MKTKILFTVVGSTDPICGKHDGSMLHICREIKPDIVYIYLSGEMMAYHKKDNRFEKTIQLLSQKINKEIEVRFIEREKLIEVHIFDSFYPDFEMEINKITKEYGEDAEIYLNVSGGTAAMQSALQVIAATSSVNLTPLQVGTYKKGLNYNKNNVDNYNIEKSWEENEDNKNNYEKRVVLSSNIYFEKKLQKEVIIKHIHAYDYQAAYRVAEGIRYNIEEDALLLLEGACARIQLDNQFYIDKLKQIQIEEDVYKKIIPYPDGFKGRVYEYALWLYIKQKRKDYSDFIRGITPMLYGICLQYIERYTSVNLTEYYQNNQTLRIDRNKLRKTEKGRKIDEVYEWKDKNKQNRNKPRRYLLNEYLTNEKMIKLIEDIEKQAPGLTLLNNLRDVEKHIRNKVAHTIIHIDNQIIESYTGLTTEQIMDKIEQLLKILEFNLDKYWRSYEEMNKEIVNRINKPLVKNERSIHGNREKL